MFSKLKKIVNKIRLLLMNPYKRAKWLRKRAYHVGENVCLVTTSFGGEPYLLSIGDDVIVAHDVKFICHDASVFNVKRMKNIDCYLDKVGPIVIGNNAFVGAYSILLPNTSIGNNSILAAGSVLTKHIPDNEVWGGNPAKRIMTTDEYAKKVIEQNYKNDYPWITEQKDIIKDKKTLVKLRKRYFFGGDD